MSSTWKPLVTTLAITATIVTAGLANTTTAQASKWHAGTPKVMRGTWYLKSPAEALHVTKSGFAYQVVLHSTHYHAYYLNDSYNWRDHAKYRSLGHHRYRVVATGHGAESAYPNRRHAQTFTITKKHLTSNGVTWNKHQPKPIISLAKAMKHS